jgi:photoactive yellow protein
MMVIVNSETEHPASILAINQTHSTRITFASSNMLPWIEAATDPMLDALSFGCVRMDRTGRVVSYNAAEATLAGLRPEQALGRYFFTQVAPCSNIPGIAGRFAAEPDLDHTMPYVFSLRLRPVPVLLRLLQSAAHPHRYLLVDRRASNQP